MGASNTKIINSLSGALSRRDSKESKSEKSAKMLLQVRSNSLDSISTSHSFGMHPQQQTLSRASSLDNLQSPPRRSRLITVHGKQYMLIDSSPAVESVSDSKVETNTTVSVRENPPRGANARGKTSSRDTKKALSRSRSDPVYSKHRVNKELDQFSDNFVTVDCTDRVKRLSSVDRIQDICYEESKPLPMPGRSILKGHKTLNSNETPSGLSDHPDISKLLGESPQISPSALAKLTSEEWEQIVNFACASLGKSLQLLRTLGDAKTPSSTEASSASSTHKHVTINKDVSSSVHDRGSIVASTDGLHTLGNQERPRRQRRRRRDRPNSLPSVYVESTGIKDPCPQDESKQEAVVASIQPRARAHSHGGSTYYRCSSDPTRPKAPRAEQHYPCSSRSRRKKAAKSQKTSNAPIDASLDDNCPGVAKIRRSHRHTHHHSLCGQYVHRTEATKERRYVKDWDFEDLEVVVNEYRNDKSSAYVTLQDMQAASSILKQSAEVAERLQTVASVLEGSIQNHTQSPVLGTEHASIKNEELEVIDASQMSTQVRGLNDGWSDLVFPKRSRSGRDSPATDMAVISLDINTPAMHKPIRAKKLNNNHYTAIDTSGPAVSQQMLVHNHNHYHHIIHYTQS